MDNLPSSPAPNSSRRRFLQQSVAAATFGAVAQPSMVRGSPEPQTQTIALPPAFDKLAPLGPRVHPITPAEFSERIEHAQRVMADPKSQATDSSSTPPQKYDALFLAPGTYLVYFSGGHWGLSERLLGLVLPGEGTP